MIIPAYKEERRPVRLLETVEESKLGEYEPEEIFVVVCGNVEPVKDFSEETELPVRIIEEEERQGKAAAINTALGAVESERVVLSSADILLQENTLRELLKGLEEDKVGIITAHPVSMDSSDSFRGYFNNLIWNLHHYVSKKDPKAGEIIAFENVIETLPENTAADEEFIKSKILDKGYESRYSEKAVIYNRGPENVARLFDQRWRIFIGHLDLENRTNYSPSSMRTGTLMKSVLEYLKENGPHPYILLSMLLELSARSNAWISYKLLRRNPYIWDKGC